MKWRIFKCYKFITVMKVCNPTSTKGFFFTRNLSLNAHLDINTVYVPISYAAYTPTWQFDVRGKLFNSLEKNLTEYGSGLAQIPRETVYSACIFDRVLNISGRRISASCCIFPKQYYLCFRLKDNFIDIMYTIYTLSDSTPSCHLQV